MTITEQIEFVDFKIAELKEIRKKLLCLNKIGDCGVSNTEPLMFRSVPWDSDKPFAQYFNGEKFVDLYPHDY